MDKETAAVIYRFVPGDKQASLHQRGLKWVLSDWQVERYDDFERVLENQEFEIGVGFQVVSKELGANGYDTGYHFQPEINGDFLGPELQPIAVDFYEDWVRMIRKIIEDDVSGTLFSPKQLAAFYLHRHPKVPESRAADALGVTVGTYRGKVGRVVDKLKQARRTITISESTEPLESLEDWLHDGYEGPLPVIHHLPESRLPVNATRPPEGYLPEGNVKQFIRD